MPIQVEWTDPGKQILLFTYEDWTWEDLFTSIETSRQMMDEATLPVASIIKLAPGKQQLLPDLDESIKQLVEDHMRHPKDSGVTVFVNAETVTKAMIDMIINHG